ncbi:hypothetical protein TSAR_016531, partial [Trichomalopsis sarcophagae]
FCLNCISEAILDQRLLKTKDVVSQKQIIQKNALHQVLVDLQMSTDLLLAWLKTWI